MAICNRSSMDIEFKISKKDIEYDEAFAKEISRIEGVTVLSNNKINIRFFYNTTDWYDLIAFIDVYEMFVKEYNINETVMIANKLMTKFIND